MIRTAASSSNIWRVKMAAAANSIGDSFENHPKKNILIKARLITVYAA